MPRNRYRALGLLAIILAAGLATDACRSTSASRPVAPDTPADDNDEAYKKIKLFTHALLQVRNEYVDAAKIGYTNLVYGAIQGMMDSLDPHSQFMDPDSLRDMKDDTQGEFGGVGIIIGVKEGALTVIAPMEDTPADRAGVLGGDRIVEIDAVKSDKMDLKDAVKHLRGAKGTRVTITVIRAGSKEPIKFTLERDLIKVTSVKGTCMLDEQIGYVRITQFSDPTAKEVEDALQKLHGQHMRALIIDLRNNPGGLLNAAIAVCEKFLAKGSVIVITKGRSTLTNQGAVKANGTGLYTTLPLAILINGGSASAAEIVAGALRDNRRAVLVGELTFGKASVQTILNLDEGALRLTTAHYFTPSEKAIHEKGIEPDIVVPMTPDEWYKVLQKRGRIENPALYSEPATEQVLQAVDRQLERAKDMLHGILIFNARQPAS